MTTKRNDMKVAKRNVRGRPRAGGPGECRVLSILSRCGEFSGDLSEPWRVLTECGEDVRVVDTFEQPPVRPPNGEDGFDAVFVTASGEQRRVPWRRLPLVVDEIGGPVRSLRTLRGQSYPGWYWSATLWGQEFTSTFVSGSPGTGGVTQTA